MAEEPSKEQQERSKEFQQEAEQPQAGIVAEFVDFLLHSKKWWLTPIILVLLAVGLLAALAATGVAPFIYPFV